MRVLFVETEQASQFSPIALVRPVFELLCGIRSVRERVLATLQPESWGVVVRPHLEAIYRHEFPEAHVNDPAWIDAEETWIINGLWVCDPRLLPELPLETMLCRDGIPLVWRRSGRGSASTENSIQNLMNSIPDTITASSSSAGILLRYPWETVKYNGAAIRFDYELLKSATDWMPPAPAGRVAHSEASDAEAIRIHESAHVEPFVSVNAEAGPVIIDRDARIQSFTRLEGPCYIGPETQLFSARIRGETSLGPVCRVGGEVEASIIHGYANKYHDGFLGHAYVCPWVNLGAMTTNSDLKNDYSQVKFPVGTEYLPTGEMKLGCLIGDHAKTAIGTLLNTGTHLGVMAMALPAGKLCPKFIPSFCRLWQGNVDDKLEFEIACETAAIAMQRRQQEFTPLHRELLLRVRDLTSSHRASVLM